MVPVAAHRDAVQPDVPPGNSADCHRQSRSSSSGTPAAVIAS
jgi:hypothetical protein